jgi:hypothetical protein
VPRSRDRRRGVGPDEAALGVGACAGLHGVPDNTMQLHKQPPIDSPGLQGTNTDTYDTSVASNRRGRGSSCVTLHRQLSLPEANERPSDRCARAQGPSINARPHDVMPLRPPRRLCVTFLHPHPASLSASCSQHTPLQTLPPRTPSIRFLGHPPSVSE